MLLSQKDCKRKVICVVSVFFEKNNMSMGKENHQSLAILLARYCNSAISPLVPQTQNFKAVENV